MLSKYTVMNCDHESRMEDIENKHDGLSTLSKKRISIEDTVSSALLIVTTIVMIIVIVNYGCKRTKNSSFLTFASIVFLFGRLK